jgi:hypothetical protein
VAGVGAGLNHVVGHDDQNVAEGMNKLSDASSQMSKASYLLMFGGVCQIALSYLVIAKFPTEIRSNPNVFNAVSAANLAAMLAVANMVVG